MNTFDAFDERKFSIYKQLRIMFDSSSGFPLSKEDAWKIAEIILNKTITNDESRR